MNNKTGFAPALLLFALLFSLAACMTPTSSMKLQATVTIHSSFQSRLSPVPPLPSSTCGAWTSSTGPSIYGIITIYAKLTHDIAGIAGAPATAIVHFAYGNVLLEQHQVSDHGGYVAFTLPLAGRQPRGFPATVDVSFKVSGGKVQCSTFFTPF